MLIGLDLGTTVLKAIAIDAHSGVLLGEVSQRLPVTTDTQGLREQDPAMLNMALAETLTSLRRQAGPHWSHTKGIGLATQGGSTIIADRHSGQPLTPMILWNDARAIEEFQSLVTLKPAQWWREFSLRDEPGMGLARIRWLRRHHPDLFDKRNIYIGAGEYLYHQLTRHWRQDASNALQIGCYDARRQTLTDQSLSLVDLSLDFFAPMRQGHTTFALGTEAAARHGLPAGIPVAGPYSDHEAGYLAASGHAGNPIQVSLGTAWVGNFLLPELLLGQSPTQLVVPGPDGFTRQIIQPLLTGNVTWDWALATFMDGDHDSAMRRQGDVFDESLLPPEGLVALPWLNQPNPFFPRAHGAAALLGICPATNRDDLLRAVTASMVFELHRVISPLVGSQLFDRMILTGGSSKGCVFQQLIAALFDPLPVFCFDREDLAGARGCLAAFGHEAARSPARRIALASDTTNIIKQAKIYRKIFSAFYGGIHAGGAYRLKSNREDQG